MPRLHSITLLLAVVYLSVVPAGAADVADPEAVIRRAVNEAADIEAQARALMNLAWPADGSSTPELQAMARQELVNYGKHGLKALRLAIRTVDRRYTADLMTAIIQARLQVTSGIPVQYHPVLEDVMWYGSIDAKRLACHELAKQHFEPALLAVLDSIYDHPELTALVVRDLGIWRDYRSRFELRRVLDRGSVKERELAAEALAKIGGTAIEQLRDATLANDSLTRRTAIAAFLPESNVNDLTALYEYIAEYGEEDPGLTERIVARTRYLESVFEAQRDAEAASPDLDD